jgi:hypothetical protein
VKVYFGKPALWNSQEIVEVKFWEIYLLNNRANLYKFLAESSIDSGPVEQRQYEPGRVSYRFFTSVWQSKVKPLLLENRIPVVLKTSLSHTVRPDNCKDVSLTTVKGNDFM